MLLFLVQHILHIPYEVLEVAPAVAVVRPQQVGQQVPLHAQPLLQMDATLPLVVKGGIGCVVEAPAAGVGCLHGVEVPAEGGLGQGAHQMFRQAHVAQLHARGLHGLNAALLHLHFGQHACGEGGRVQRVEAEVAERVEDVARAVMLVGLHHVRMVSHNEVCAVVDERTGQSALPG